MMNSLKKYRQAFLVLLFCMMGLANKSSATHYAAVDMYIDFVGADSTDLKYKVTLDVYKSCEWSYNQFNNSYSFNAPLNGTYNITYTSGCFPAGSFNVDTVGANKVDTLDQLCPNLSASNLCHSPTSPWPSFMHIRYTKIITLPGRCADYVFAWTNSARNDGITNLCLPGGQAIYVDLKFNNLRHYNNSSPRFTVVPIPYFCINVPSVFFNVPVDPDGNILLTVNSQPRGCLSNCAGLPACTVPGAVGYTGVYNLTNPVNSSNGYQVNPSTGNATFTPTATGKFVLAMRCYEIDPVSFDTIGYITRDVQVSILNCNSGPPTIDPHPNNTISAIGAKIDTSSNTVYACPGVTAVWSLASQSAFNSNSVTMTAEITPASNNPITYTVVGQNSGTPNMVFTWTPTEDQVDSVYTVLITSRDSTCNTGQPIIFKSYASFVARTVANMQAGADRYGYCPLNNDSIQLRSQGPDILNIQYNWVRTFDGTSQGIYNPTDKNPKAITNQTTEYVVYTDDMPLGCKNSDTMTINVDNSNSVEVTAPSPKDPYVLCRPGYIDLDAEGHGNAPLSNIPCEASTVPICANPETITVSVPYDGFKPSKKIDTSATPFIINNKRHQFLLKKADLLGSGLYSGTLTSLKIDGLYLKNPANTSVLTDVQISLKCTTLESLTGALQGGITNVYAGTGNITFSGTNVFSVTFPFTTPYNWDTTQNLIVEICYAGITNAVYAEYFSAGYRAHNVSSTCAVATAATTVPFATRIPRFTFGYCHAPEVDYKYTWHPGVFVSDSTIKAPSAYIPDDMQYFVTTKGRRGCLVIDSFMVYVPTHNFDILPKDTSICLGETVPFRALPNKDNMGYKWYEVNGTDLVTATTLNDDTDPTPVAKPTSDGITYYAVVLTDSVYCSDTLRTSVVVRPLPNVKVLTNDTTIKYGSSIRLIASGASLYTWSPINNLTDPNLVNPVATPTEPTLFQLYGIGSNGCRGHDSVFVYIDYRGKLFIPTAFTPNGDGKNDRFGLVNLSFQKVIEFRIFNRWGQEVFSTIDNKTGWDGRWKGVEQPASTYNYIIRVGYPDGYAETYKGDITLIR